MIQIVYETLKDQQEGKKGRVPVKAGGASESSLRFFLFLLIICVAPTDTGIFAVQSRKPCSTQQLVFLIP